jgi:predicted nuclease of predicted toxin-antitoxin system
VKLLFDENLSFRLARELADVYPGSSHVRDVGLLGAEDPRIWEHTAEHDFMIVSKDTDFYQRSLAHGSPPKVIWLRLGNVPTSSVADVLRNRYPALRDFSDDEDSAFMALDDSHR